MPGLLAPGLRLVTTVAVTAATVSTPATTVAEATWSPVAVEVAPTVLAGTAISAVPAMTLASARPLTSRRTPLLDAWFSASTTPCCCAMSCPPGPSVPRPGDVRWGNGDRRASRARQADDRVAGPSRSTALRVTRRCRNLTSNRAWSSQPWRKVARERFQVVLQRCQGDQAVPGRAAADPGGGRREALRQSGDACRQKTATTLGTKPS